MQLSLDVFFNFEDFVLGMFITIEKNTCEIISLVVYLYCHSKFDLMEYRHILENKITQLESEVAKLRDALEQKEVELHNHEIALVVFKEIDHLQDTTSDSQNFKQPRLTVKDFILNAISAASDGITSNEIIEKYAEIKGMEKKKARNSIYPYLSEFKRTEEIEAVYRPEKPHVSYWIIKKIALAETRAE
jgi:hypothetical protein